MHDNELPNQGRRVRSADAAVIKAVEHEAALERKAEQRAARQNNVRKPAVKKAPAQRSAKAKKTQNRYTNAVRPDAPRTKKNHVLVLLLLLLFVMIIGAGVVAAITIYNEDTEMIISENTVEAGTSANLSMYVTGEPTFPEYVKCNLDFAAVNYNIPQTIRFTVTMYGTNFPCVLNIVDTIAPTAEGIPQTLYSVDEIPPVEECITNVYDLNDVTLAWAELPDISGGGQLVAKASVTDSSGNVTYVDVPLSVTRDVNAPVIEGTEDIEAYQLQRRCHDH